MQAERPPARAHNPYIYSCAGSDPQELATSLDGNTEWGDELTAEIGVFVRYIRIFTPDSLSWVCWLEIEVVLYERTAGGPALKGGLSGAGGERV